MEGSLPTLHSHISICIQWNGNGHPALLIDTHKYSYTLLLWRVDGTPSYIYIYTHVFSMERGLPTSHSYIFICIPWKGMPILHYQLKHVNVCIYVEMCNYSGEEMTHPPFSYLYIYTPWKVKGHLALSHPPFSYLLYVYMYVYMNMYIYMCGCIYM